MNDDEIRELSADDLLRRSAAKVRIVADRAAVAVEFARVMAATISNHNQSGRNTVFIMPVGPTGQWRLFAERANAEGLDLTRLFIFNMDEYLGSDGLNLPPSHPFSFARFVKEEFLEVLQPGRGFKPENLCVPNSQDLSRPERAIKAAGGVDIAFAGIGLNGHLAFNEPPETTEGWSDESFARSTVRIVKLAGTTKATNAIFGTGGDLSLVPDYAVSLGMREILGARAVHVFLDWHWQQAVVRRALFGPVTRFFPASLLQRHPSVAVTLSQEVAAKQKLKPE